MGGSRRKERREMTKDRYDRDLNQCTGVDRRPNITSMVLKGPVILYLGTFHASTTDVAERVA